MDAFIDNAQVNKKVVMKTSHEIASNNVYL